MTCLFSPRSRTTISTLTISRLTNSFGFRITVDGDYFAFAGMSLGDLVTINQHIAEAIRKGRRSAL